MGGGEVGVHFTTILDIWNFWVAICLGGWTYPPSKFLNKKILSGLTGSNLHCILVGITQYDLTSFLCYGKKASYCFFPGANPIELPLSCCDMHESFSSKKFRDTTINVKSTYLLIKPNNLLKWLVESLDAIDLYKRNHD